jgi:hypothetical protein
MTSFSGQGSTHCLYCTACKQRGEQIFPNAPKDLATFYYKPEKFAYCFDGQHVTMPLSANDQRRVSLDTFALKPSPTLQHEIDNLPLTARIVTIQSVMYDSEDSFTFNVKLPNLEQLKIVDVQFSKIVLTRETTPNLEDISFQNVDESCHLTIVLPKLRRYEVGCLDLDLLSVSVSDWFWKWVGVLFWIWLCFFVFCFFFFGFGFGLVFGFSFGFGSVFVFAFGFGFSFDFGFGFGIVLV